MSETEKAQIAAAVKQDIENSDYAEQAAAYVMAVMLESDGLLAEEKDEAPAQEEADDPFAGLFTREGKQ